MADALFQTQNGFVWDEVALENCGLFLFFCSFRADHNSFNFSMLTIYLSHLSASEMCDRPGQVVHYYIQSV